MGRFMSNVRILPEPHRYAVCAAEDIPIKDFYKGVFEEIFVFFHPFIRPKMMDFDLFNPETYPGRNDIREHCEMVTWKQFLSLSGIKSYKQLDIGLRTSILGLIDERQDVKTANIIQETCLKNRIAEPAEGVLPEFIMNHLLRGIKAIGHSWIWLGDEFCTERKLENIDDLISDNNLIDGRISLFTHDNKILITTHWDSHFSLLCSDKVTVESLVDSCRLEGFYCKEDTEIYWSLSEGN